MVRDRIVFRHGIQISFKAVGAEHFSTDPSAEVFDLQDSGLAVFFYKPDPASNAEQSAALEALCAEQGGSCMQMEPDSLRPEKFSFLNDTFRRVKKSLGSKKNVTIFYSDAEEEPVTLLACMFLLTVQARAPKAINPENSIKYFAGSEQSIPGDELVYRFKDFLEGDTISLAPPPASATPNRVDQVGSEPGGHHDNGHSGNAASVVSEQSPDAGPATSAPAAEAAPEESAATAPAPAPAPSAPPPSITAPAYKPPPPAPVQSAAPAAASQPPVMSDFKQSKFTIQVKLLSIITGIIVLSLGSMIYFASNFFQSDSEARIQENNLTLARVIGQRVQSELENIRFKAQLASASLERPGGDDFATIFFKNNADFLFMGIAEQAGGQLVIKRQWLNNPQLEIVGVKVEDFASLHAEGGAEYKKAFGGTMVVNNASRGETPLLGISMPLGDVTRNAIILVYLEPSGFLNSFKTEGIIQTFMVNSEGGVIAHPEGKRVLARQNLSELGIVAAMLESATNNGNTVYDDPETDQEFLGSFAKLTVGGLGVISTVDSDKAFAAVKRIRNWNLFIMGMVMAIAFVIIYFFAKTMTVPVVSLVDATEKIERQEYDDLSIKPTTRDEIGKLTDSFVRMAQGLGEREKLKDAMVKFVNKQIADLAMKGQIKLGGEQKDDVAVFFSDLRGFTAMSEKMTAEEVVSYLNEYFTGMVSCINQTHGIVDKFIGDAVMAHWGAFESHGNDTENAINGALMMRHAIIAFNERGGGNRPFAKQGCGINTGRLVSGQIGSEERFEFTVIGDTVNLASRIEALNKPFGTDVLVSQDSYELVKDIFKFEPMPAIKVKGKTEPQVIYAVVGRLDDPNCPKDMDEVRAMLGIEFDSDKEIDPDAKEEKFEVVGG